MMQGVSGFSILFAGPSQGLGSAVAGRESPLVRGESETLAQTFQDLFNAETGSGADGEIGAFGVLAVFPTDPVPAAFGAPLSGFILENANFSKSMPVFANGVSGPVTPNRGFDVFIPAISNAPSIDTSFQAGPVAPRGGMPGRSDIAAFERLVAVSPVTGEAGFATAQPLTTFLGAAVQAAGEVVQSSQRATVPSAPAASASTGSPSLIAGAPVMRQPDPGSRPGNTVLPLPVILNGSVPVDALSERVPTPLIAAEPGAAFVPGRVSANLVLQAGPTPAASTGVPVSSDATRISQSVGPNAASASQPAQMVEALPNVVAVAEGVSRQRPVQHSGQGPVDQPVMAPGATGPSVKSDAPIITASQMPRPVVGNGDGSGSSVPVRQLPDGVQVLRIGQGNAPTTRAPALAEVLQPSTQSTILSVQSEIVRGQGAGTPTPPAAQVLLSGAPLASLVQGGPVLHAVRGFVPANSFGPANSLGPVTPKAEGPTVLPTQAIKAPLSTPQPVPSPGAVAVPEQPILRTQIGPETQMGAPEMPGDPRLADGTAKTAGPSPAGSTSSVSPKSGIVFVSSAGSTATTPESPVVSTATVRPVTTPLPQPVTRPGPDAVPAPLDLADLTGHLPVDRMPEPLRPEPPQAALSRVLPHPASISGQIAERFIQRFDGLSTRFELRLDPPELGKVDVRIEVGADNRVQAVLAVRDPAALEALMRGAKTLENALTQAGVNLNENGLSFEMRQGGQDGRFARDPNQHGQTESLRQTAGDPEPDAAPSSQSHPRIQQVEAGRLNLTA